MSKGTWDWVGVAYSGAMATGISLRCCLTAVPDFRLPTHSTSPDHVCRARGVTDSDTVEPLCIIDIPFIERCPLFRVSIIHESNKGPYRQVSYVRSVLYERFHSSLQDGELGLKI